MKSRIAVTTVTGVLLLTACGSGGSSTSGSDQKYVDALVTGLQRDSSQGGTGFTDSENVCIAEGVVRIIGVKAFEDAGISPDDLAKSDQTKLPDVSDAKHEELRALLFDGDCVDMVSTIAATFKSAASSVADDTKVNCLAKAVVNDESMQNYIVDGLLGRDTTAVETEISTLVQTAATDCGIGS